jgi:hypothetical protein
MLEADTLLQHHLEGTLTDAESEELHTRLQNEPQLGSKLLQHFEMDAMLRATKPLAVPGKVIQPALMPKRRFTVTTVAAMAACTMLLGTWIVLPWLKWDAEETTASIAVLTRGVNLEW